MEVIRDFRRLFPTVMDRAYDQSKELRHVSDIMSSEVVTVAPEASMGEAAKIMGERRIGSLIVVKNRKPAGIVTERDLLSRVIATGLSPEKVKVGEVMSSPIISISPSATIREAARAMIRQKGRLAVFDDKKPSRKYRKGSKYDPILDKFLNGKDKLVTVEVAGKDGNYVRTQLRKNSTN